MAFVAKVSNEQGRFGEVRLRLTAKKKEGKGRNIKVIRIVVYTRIDLFANGSPCRLRIR